MTLQSIVRQLFNFGLFFLSTVVGAELSSTIEKIKPSIVAVGTFKATQSPQFAFRGTGFVINSSNEVVTNSHVLPDSTQLDSPELAVLVRGPQERIAIRRAQVVRKEPAHDLAIIRVEGPPLPALEIGDSNNVREGQAIAFTGFPIGGALGFTPVTHRGIIAAKTPIALPGGNARQLNDKLIQQLKRGSFEIFQLDATAYPGNSGSPLYDPETGTVIGVINMVFVKGSKEAAITNPSGITYAIPVLHLKALLSTN